jgi:hypothetical protein
MRALTAIVRGLRGGGDCVDYFIHDFGLGRNFQYASKE